MRELIHKGSSYEDVKGVMKNCERVSDYSIYVFYIGHGGDGDDFTHGDWHVTGGGVVEEDYIERSVITSNLLSLTNCTGCHNSAM